MTYSDILDLEDAASIAAVAANRALAAWRKGKSNVRLVAAQEADAAYQIALATLESARDAMEAQEVLNAATDAAAIKASEMNAQPSFGF